LNIEPESKSTAQAVRFRRAATHGFMPDEELRAQTKLNNIGDGNFGGLRYHTDK
jgi:hypothetical protein